jgi:hypothetical protein
MRAVRRLAASGGHPLPKRIAPAENNLKGILTAASQRDRAVSGPPLIIGVLVGTLLLGVLLVVGHRRMMREPEPDASGST